MSLSRAAMSTGRLLSQMRGTSTSLVHRRPTLQPLPIATSFPAENRWTHLARHARGTTSHSEDAAASAPTPETIPLPSGVDGSRVGLYEIVGTSGTGAAGDGFTAIFGVHGPREFWPGGGGNIDAAGGGSFAVIEAAGRQYKVTAGDTLYTNRIPGEVNEEFVFDKVALVGTMLWTVFGRPLIPGAVVRATIESQTRSAKVMSTKYKKRKGYRRRVGHRQPITRFHIDSVDYETPDGDLLEPYEVEFDPLKPPLPNNVNLV